MTQFLFFFALLLSSTITYAQSSIYIKVGQAQVKKSLIALPNFKYLGSPTQLSKTRSMGRELINTVNNDLDVSSYFQFIKKEAFLEDTQKTGLKPSTILAGGFDFQNWRAINAEFLIRGGYYMIGERFVFEAYLYHVPKGDLIFGKKYTTQPTAVRRVAHQFSNDVLFALTGKKGMFLTKLVVSSDRAGGRNKEIFVMDWDGHNPQQITRMKNIAISPAWSPDNKQIAFTAFHQRVVKTKSGKKRTKKRNADLFLHDLTTGKRKVISARPGINSGAAFMPGSEELFLTISKGGHPDIYKINKKGRILKQITRGPRGAMNVEPAISPDGKHIAFSSDRSGRPMIFVKNLATGKTKRVIFRGWYNASPTWSPDSQKIAFAGFDKTLRHFDIFLMNRDGSGLIRLTTAKKKSGKYSNNEDPTFSPDGRHVIFISDRTGTNQVYMVNIDGSNERRLTFDQHNYYKPKWSNILD